MVRQQQLIPGKQKVWNGRLLHRLQQKTSWNNRSLQKKLMNIPERRLKLSENPALLHQFDSVEQQREASNLGMWMFLITEIMFFGGLILTYVINRMLYFDAFAFATNT